MKEAEKKHENSLFFREVSKIVQRTKLIFQTVRKHRKRTTALLCACATTVPQLQPPTLHFSIEITTTTKNVNIILPLEFQTKQRDEKNKQYKRMQTYFFACQSS